MLRCWAWFYCMIFTPVLVNFEKISLSMYRIILLTGILTGLWGGTHAGGPRDNLLPMISGYQLVQDYPVYTPETLRDYINGAAQSYVSFHFEELQIGEYVNGTGRRIKVEVYKHKSSEYAYGIYCSERYPDNHFIEVGAQGYTEEGLVNFVTGEYYVKVMTSTEGLSKDELIFMAHKISAWLNESPRLPKILEVFPEQGKTDKSECFFTGNFLGHEFLKDVYVASYDQEGEQFDMFIIQREQGSECIKVVEDYLKFADKESTGVTNGQYSFQDLHNGEVVLWLKDNIIIGFLECTRPSTIDEYTGMVRDRLKLM